MSNDDIIFIILVLALSALALYPQLSDYLPWGRTRREVAYRRRELKRQAQAAVALQRLHPNPEDREAAWSLRVLRANNAEDLGVCLGMLEGIDADAERRAELQQELDYDDLRTEQEQGPAAWAAKREANAAKAQAHYQALFPHARGAREG